jgi:hypothetical protein
VLYPATARQDLFVLELVAAHLDTVVIEDHAAGTGGALVDGGYEFWGPSQRTSPTVTLDVACNRP